jgi:Protein of unknown function (DUF2867)
MIVLMESGHIPFVDAHSVLISATPADTWDALLYVVAVSFDRPAVALLTSLLGCKPARGSGGDLAKVGTSLPGFRVAEADPQRTLALEGRHRFSRYRLVFVLEQLGEARCSVRAETWAEFPGVTGRVYRALVIGSHGHVLVVRSMLAGMRRRAATA